jgi:hypothetical protein
MSDIEKRSVEETTEQPIVYERPKGVKGIYYNTYTQVYALHHSTITSLISH